MLTKQRGIYSETVHPHNAAEFRPEQLVSGPSQDIVLQTFHRQKHQLRTHKSPKIKHSHSNEQIRLFIRQELRGEVVEPAVKVPFEPIPGMVPRRVAIDRKKKEYQSFNLSKLLKEELTELAHCEQQWLPLSLFDNRQYDQCSYPDLISLQWDQEGVFHPLTGKGLKVSESGKAKYRSLQIKSFEDDRFVGRWLKDGSPAKLSRLFICFDFQNPLKYVQRVKQAFRERQKANVSIRYNYIIDNMPLDDLTELDEEQRKRIMLMTQGLKFKEESLAVSSLVTEVNDDFKRTMCKIILDHQLNLRPQILSFEAPQRRADEEVRERGMMVLERQKGVLQMFLISPKEKYPIPPRTFKQLTGQFCFATLFMKTEVVKAIQEIRFKCNLVEEKDIFDFNVSGPLYLDRYKHQQESIQSQILYYLKGSWIPDLVNIIKSKFSEVKKGWFNMKETNKITYDFGKLKKFLTMVRLMMEDTLLSIVKRNYYAFVDFFQKIIPLSVLVHSSHNVVNTYPSENYQPLFQIEMVKTVDNEINYITREQSFVSVILNLFERTLEEFGKINDIEPQILADLYKSQKMQTYIKSPQKPKQKPKDPDPNERPLKLPDENLWLWLLYEQLRIKIQSAVQPLSLYLRSFDRFKDKLKINPEQYILKVQLEDPPRDIQSIREQIIRLKEQVHELGRLIPERIHVGMFEINCANILVELREINQHLVNNLIQLIARRIRDKIMYSFSEYQAIKNKINSDPKSIEQLVDLNSYFQLMDSKLAKIKLDVDESFENYKVVEEFNYRYTNDEFNKRWMVFSAPKEIAALMQARTKAMQKLKVKFLEQMKQNQKTFESNFLSTEMTIAGFHQSFNKMQNYQEAYQATKIVSASLQTYFEQSKKYSLNESMFGVQQTEYSKIHQMAKDFQPYNNLWTVVYEWQKKFQHWMNGSWTSLDVQDSQRFVEEGIRTLNSCIRVFGEKKIACMQKIALNIKEEMQKFKPKVPVLRALKNKGIKANHLEEISAAIGQPLNPDADFSFRQALEMGVMDHIEKIVQVGERAGKQYGIEMSLERMQSEWQKITFEVIPYKSVKDSKGQNTLNYIIRSYETIINKLDEHIVNTQTLQYSPFKKPFEEQLILWDTTLRLMSQVIDQWIKFQQQWMYLQPIFDSQDIAKQLPQQSKRFRNVDTHWKLSMNQVRANPSVLKNMTEEGLLQRSKDANKSIELIQKELNNYLQKKKQKFARFYFLSNLQLLQILSQAKDPLAVQPHLKKVFENIHRIDFSQDKKITTILSEERQSIRLVKPIDPNKRNVEEWMNQLQHQMHMSVRNVILKGLQSYTHTLRTNWVLEHPGQVVLTASQVRWTNQVEQAFKDKGQPVQEGQEEKPKTGIQKYFEKLQGQLIGLVNLVRTKLDKQQKTTLGALIVIDVHAKDVVQKLLRHCISEQSSFEWISQLRYYLEQDIRVKCIQTDFPYGYQYLGNTLRLVITPLTDKCYMTLMSALKLNLGGAPAGPAGTGKTETTKDLAKALAKQCLVFNCSSQMDFIMIGKFFKGLASAGAWACFDQFNRINIEVLSVVAQQLMVLFGEKAKGTTSMLFQQSNIRINPYFSVFITMNPGYAGRTELPDNLKALFRPVAMMVPDYSMIGQILLYSFGFEKGRQLARKMVATFKLSSEQLSSQDHYDYGMRAVRSVINAAGILKMNHPEMNEDQLLLRALMDVNVPKFLKDDLPLFESIITDLFPGVQKPQQNYGQLLKSIQSKCVQNKLQGTKLFIEKIIHLFDTIQVRHGLMLVGPTGGGKTSNYKVLQQALTGLKNQGYYRVVTHILNPKSITMGQLYGQFQELSHEWTDGILASIIRDAVTDESRDRHWVMFDGPVDALWIESMNTVLDDNKKLCLNSGQILTLTQFMTMMFEVQDLSVASPATVSRCGMVYMQPTALGYFPLIDSWLQCFPSSIESSRRDVKLRFQAEFKKIIPKLLAFKDTKGIKQFIPASHNTLVSSLLKLITCMLKDFIDTQTRKVTQEQLGSLQKNVQNLVLFAAVWSIGCTTDLQGKNKFKTVLRQICQIQFTDNTSIYDNYFDLVEMRWVPWKNLYKSFQIDRKTLYHEITVPTQDNTRIKAIVKLLIQNTMNVLTPGPIGTGKSINILSLLTKELSDQFQYIFISFSAQTSANQTQDTIDSKMNKRSKRRFGPNIGKKCVVFIDDFNMPKKEEFGAQPPIQLIRQYLDHGGWYNRKELYPILLQDLMMLCAMGFPGGGRNQITDRCVRHFNMITYTQLDNQTIREIFRTITGHFYRRFNEQIKNSIPSSVEAIVLAYQKIRKDFLPTPAKSHYTFNLRDVWKVYQGICAIRSVPIDKELLHFYRVNYHELARVFNDRLVTESDRKHLQSIIIEVVPQSLRGQLYNNQPKLLFADFVRSRGDDRPYTFVQDVDRFISIVERYQEDYNNQANSKKSLRLVLFLDACQHIARICRILRYPRGNALLLGVGGSGRQSLARLASFINNFKIFQIQFVKNYTMKKWRQDIKQLLMKAGLQRRPQVFLLTDNQIQYEQMMEDLNNIINSGDVVGIYDENQLEEINQAFKQPCIKAGLQPNKMNTFTFYLQQLMTELHCIIAMSPIGNIFATRLRMYPALVSCCTIDWFTEWPEQALRGVGMGQLIDYQQQLSIKSRTARLVNIFKRVHVDVQQESMRFKQEFRRTNYVTPTSYLELLSLFRNILLNKRKDWKTQTLRLSSGLQKLNSANIAVENMRVELKEKQPKLILAQEQTNRMMKVIEQDRQKAKLVQKKAQQEQKLAQEATEQAMRLKKQVEQQVAQANRKISQTKLKMQQIKSTHLSEIKTFTYPVQAIVVVMSGVCILFKENIYNKKPEEIWAISKKKIFTDSLKLVQRLKNYDVEKEVDQVMKDKLNRFVINHPKFNQTDSRTSCQVVYFLYCWVKACYDYYNKWKQSEPKRQKERQMLLQVAAKETALAEIKQLLDTTNRNIRNLQNQFEEKAKQIQTLSKEIVLCKTKLERASKLTDGLKDQKARWTNEISQLITYEDLLPGNSALAAAMLSYSGPFVSTFRSAMQKRWIGFLREEQILHSEGVTMRKFLGDQVKIQSWNIAGLPKDDTSIENGIIIDKSRRWPLMIDPQSQANKFLKRISQNNDKDINFQVIKANDPNLIKSLEQSIQFGRWVLVENVGAELDPSLEPILLQQVIKSGNDNTIIIGQKVLVYHDNFRLFLTTVLPNPQYSPQTSAKVTIINFGITLVGLEEQMLATAIALQAPNLQSKKMQIVRKNAQDKRDLIQIEDQILKSLSETKAGIQELLMDESLIIKLQISKKKTIEINQRFKDSKLTQEEIDKNRQAYRPLAKRASLLFFCIIELANIDPMYQYSLQWFISLFRLSIQATDKLQDLSKKLQLLKDNFTYSLYINICRSLFQKHKILISMLLTHRILQSQHLVDQLRWRFMLTGPTGTVKLKENPTTWISESSWPDIYRNIVGMSQLQGLKKVEQTFIHEPGVFQQLYESNSPGEVGLPSQLSDLSQFDHMLLIKSLRPDRVIYQFHKWVKIHLGQKFIRIPTFDLQKCYQDSTKATPLIFVLTTGSDPISDFLKFAQEMNMHKRYQSISLGQGQGEKAKRLVLDAVAKGNWALLQNCHLAKSWMNSLQELVQSLGENTHKDFRIWLTSMPSQSFPISVLQNGIKMTLEPPKGLKNNLLRSYQRLSNKDLLQSCKKPDQFRKLLFGFCLFHAIVQERRKFGPIGWNIQYEFTVQDLDVSRRQLALLLNEYEKIPFQVINFLGAEINYGGRVTDDKDLRLIKTIIEAFINPDSLRDKHKYSTSSHYYSLPVGLQADYINYIQSLPANAPPQIFGLHQNAQIINSQNQMTQLMHLLLSIQPRNYNSASGSAQNFVEQFIKTIESKMPKRLDIKTISEAFPTDYNQSMNTVLTQEVVRYDRLLAVMVRSIAELKRALKGFIVMSEELEEINKSLYENKVPKLWAQVGFLSMKPLSLWIQDLQKRVQFLRNWVKEGTPKCFWISGFFFPQAFITGTLQNFARRMKIAIDRISFQYRYVGITADQVLEAPETGCYIYGIYLEGCRWDKRKNFIINPKPKELYSQLPMLNLVPVIDRQQAPEGIYNCPLYKVVSRRGTLSTTGHSTNFVMFVELPSKQHQDVWIKAGVAALLSLKH